MSFDSQSSPLIELGTPVWLFEEGNVAPWPYTATIEVLLLLKVQVLVLMTGSAVANTIQGTCTCTFLLLKFPSLISFRFQFLYSLS